MDSVGGLDLRSAGYRRASAITGGNGPRLLAKQVRYQLRHGPKLPRRAPKTSPADPRWYAHGPRRTNLRAAHTNSASLTRTPPYQQMGRVQVNEAK